MPRRKKKSRSPRRVGPPWWARLGHPAVKRGARLLIACGVFLGVGLAAHRGVERLEAHVDGLILAERPTATATFVDLPAVLSSLAGDELQVAVAPFLAGDWTDPALCRDIARAVARLHWVEEVNFVRRTAEPAFLISCRYRVPLALVQKDGRFHLVTADAVRLPGTYNYDKSWKLIQGVASSPSPPGEVWAGDDLRAGLTLAALLRDEPFSSQITAVIVDNFGGRKDRLDSHLSLATDRPGGRIRWGSAPGREIEENTVQQKLNLLRDNFARTGRADAEHLVIDVSTYPDRFVVPG